MQTSFQAPAPNHLTITECESPVGFNESLQQASLTAARLESFVTHLGLEKMGGIYDITLRMDAGDQWSAVADGLKVEPVLHTPTKIHLVLNRDSGIEHFLFMLDLEGNGELLWSSAHGSALTTCNSAAL